MLTNGCSYSQYACVVQSNVTRSFTSQMLPLLDGCGERNQVYVMGATNIIGRYLLLACAECVLWSVLCCLMKST